MMRALSLTEPWATLVAIGAKQWETRIWSTPYRGRLAIAAAKSFPRECYELVDTQPFAAALFNDAVRPVISRWHLGHIIAVVDLIDCIRITANNAPPEPEFSFGDYTPGRFMFKLENVRRLATPVPCKGALGIWTVPAEIAAQVERFE